MAHVIAVTSEEATLHWALIDFACSQNLSDRGLVLSIRCRSSFWSTFRSTICLVTPVVRSTAFACRTLPTASATVAIEFTTTTLSSLAFSFATFTSFTFATFAALVLSRLFGLVSAIVGTVITTLVALPTCRTIVFLLANLTLGLFLFRFCSLRRGLDRFGNDSKSIVLIFIVIVQQGEDVIHARRGQHGYRFRGRHTRANKCSPH